MTTFTPDTDKILDSILEVEEAGSLEREQGAELVDQWIAKHGNADARFTIEAVELGFILYVDSLTAVIGVQDVIMSDKEGYFGNEWKSAKEPKRYNGRDSWWWNEDVWVRDISNGPQVQIYALALNRGVFYEQPDPRAGIITPRPFQYNAQAPRIRVRAAVKSTPARFWPSDGDSVHSFTPTQLGSIEEALRARAAMVRASRHAGNVPWQMTGKQCFPYGNTCQFYEQCKSAHHPVSGLEGNDKWRVAFDSSDPAARLAMPFIPAELLQNPDFVVLSASQYVLHTDCAEKYRIINTHLASKEGGAGGRETGSVMHAGLAEFYRQLRAWQRAQKEKRK